jgi:uncharacterized protein (TIRG00374 family)
MNKKLILNISRTLISVGLLALIMWFMRDSIDDVGAAIRKINKPALFISALFFLAGYALLALRLRYIMGAQDLGITVRESVSLTLSGQFFSNFLPTTIGGDLIKAYYAAAITGKKAQSFASVVFDRMLGTFTLVLMVLFSYLFVRNSSYSGSINSFLIITGAVSVTLISVLFSKRIAKNIPFLGGVLSAFKLKDKMRVLYEIIYNYKKHPRFVIEAGLISLALQLVMFTAVYFIIRGLGWAVPFKTVCLLMPIISTVSMAPSINGLGIREGAFVVLYGPLMTKGGAFALSIVWDFLIVVVSLLGGLCYLTDKHYKIKIKGGRLS